jgi:hydroxymethylpyrimidine/phosphomethylpyrimidine kinase
MLGASGSARRAATRVAPTSATGPSRRCDSRAGVGYERTMSNAPKEVGRVLIVAGSDSSGGAGIQADIKTVTALGGYAATAVTALTAQNTLGVFDVIAVPPSFVAQQMELTLSDIGADCIKTGMLVSAPVIEAVVRVIEKHARSVPLVVDPVMVAKGGHSLLADEAKSLLTLRLLPCAALVTPNAPEAEALTGLSVKTPDDLSRAADALLATGAGAVLLKGGHLEGDTVVDLLRTADGVERRFESPRIASKNTHGTGCTLASAIATGIAEGLRLQDAVASAREFVAAAIRAAPGFGHGHGPLGHARALAARGQEKGARR